MNKKFSYLIVQTVECANIAPKSPKSKATTWQTLNRANYNIALELY